MLNAPVSSNSRHVVPKSWKSVTDLIISAPSLVSFSIYHYLTASSQEAPSYRNKDSYKLLEVLEVLEVL